MAYAVLLTHGTNGDVLPFLHLAEVLRARGHEVTLVTHAPYGPAARAREVEFVPLDTPEQYAHYLADARRVLLSRLGSPEPPDLLAHYHRTGLFDQIRTEVAAVVRRHRPGRTVVVGRHTSGLAALIAAEALRIPAVWLAPTPAQHLLLPVTEYLHRTALAPELNQIRSEHALSPVADWRAWLESADCQLGLWPEWFDAAGTRTPDSVTKVGFLLGEAAESGELPAELSPVLDAPEPPVLIAGSSGSILFDQFYRAAATACRRVARPAILVSPFPELLPDRLPPDLYWFPELPYRQLMPRVAAVIHHGGIGTLARALASGVPQLVLAHSFDQPDTATRLWRLGVAEWLPSTRWDPEQAGGLLRRLLTEPSYRERGARLGRLIDPARAARTAATHIERLLEPLPAGPGATRRR